MPDRVFERLGLRENPFRINPDPRYLFATPELRETVVALTTGIQERCGFMLLTGDVGTGKTTVVNHMVQWLRDQGMPTAQICYTRVDIAQFFDLMLAAFGIPYAPKGKGDALRTFSEWLVERHAAGDNPVVVIDEAQGLPFHVLREVRLLLNLETPRQNLLPVLLAGESSLRTKLESKDLRPLRQRILVRRHIAPFTAEQTCAYIETRLRIANAGAAPLFTTEAVQAVHLYSMGVARVINTLCERALLNAYAEETVPVPAHVVDEVAAELLPAPRKWAAVPAPVPANHETAPRASALPEAPATTATPLVREVPLAPASPSTRDAANDAVMMSLMAGERVQGLPLPPADAPAAVPTAAPGAAIGTPARDATSANLPLLPAGPAPLALPLIEPKHWDLLVPRAKVSEFRPVPPAELAKHPVANRPPEGRFERLLASAQKPAIANGLRSQSPFRTSRVQRLAQRIAWGRGRRRAEEFVRRALFMAERISWCEVDISAFTAVNAERKTREWLRWLQEPMGGVASEAGGPPIISSTAGPRRYWARLPRLYSPTLSRQAGLFLRWLQKPVHPAHAIRTHGARTPRGAH